MSEYIQATLIEFGIYFINIFFITSFIAFFTRYQKNATLFRFFYAGLGVKLVCSVLFGLLYKYYYGNGDTFIIFSDATAIAKILPKDPVKYLEMLFLARFKMCFRALGQRIYARAAPVIIALKD